MQGDKPDPAALLVELYQGAASPDQWPRFLGRLARRFGTETAALRVTGMTMPVAYHSWTVGLDDEADRRYRDDIVERDVFRDALATAPLGEVQASHRLTTDRAFERTESYQQIFRPYGNFYAMGTQVARIDDRAVHIGIHRPRSEGPFTEAECETLELFSPHLHQAMQVMQVLGQFQAALHGSCSALDALSYGVWLTDAQLHCRWMNRAAEDAVQAGVHGLGMQGGVLTAADPEGAARLRRTARRVAGDGWAVEAVGVGLSGATLMMVAEEARDPEHGLVDGGGLSVFLLDPERPLRANAQELRQVWGLTVAEVRLVGEFLCGLDVAEACARLGVSVHTGRTQLKSIMQKMGVNRQPDLMRKLLLGTTALGMAAR